MTPSSDERALWLVCSVLPHEPQLRAWLDGRRIAGLEVDDVIQETYTRLMTVESVAHVRSVKTYAFQTAYSVMMSHVRRSSVVSFQAIADLEALKPPSPEPSPEEEAVDRDELRRLAEAIASLPGRAREVFVLRRVHDVPQREIAARLGVSEGTVEKHMGRAIARLATLFRRGGSAPARASKAPIEDDRLTHAPRDRSRD